MGNLAEATVVQEHFVKLVYANEKTKKYCSDLKAAKKLFGGNNALAVSLLARINALEAADTLMDIIKMPTFYFHNLVKKGKRDLSGYYAIAVKTKRESWRIIIRPLDENEAPFTGSRIDQIAATVEIVEITEVSDHYE